LLLIRILREAGRVRLSMALCGICITGNESCGDDLEQNARLMMLREPKLSRELAQEHLFDDLMLRHIGVL
jgi:hypothetical protein